MKLNSKVIVVIFTVASMTIGLYLSWEISVKPRIDIPRKFVDMPEKAEEIIGIERWIDNRSIPIVRASGGNLYRYDFLRKNFFVFSEDLPVFFDAECDENDQETIKRFSGTITSCKESLAGGEAFEPKTITFVTNIFGEVYLYEKPQLSTFLALSLTIVAGIVGLILGILFNFLRSMREYKKKDNVAPNPNCSGLGYTMVASGAKI